MTDVRVDQILKVTEPRSSMNLRASLWLGAASTLLAGCHAPAPEGSLVLTQTPVGTPPPRGATVLDVRYPPGSRVVLLVPPFRTDTLRELSRGLVAAGDPCVSWDGRWVYFVGKGSEDADWQIYKVNAGGGQPEPVTGIPGGAMDPASPAHGELVFSSPVPEAGRLWTPPTPAALYGQMPGKAPSRLVLRLGRRRRCDRPRDGRVLFVSAEPRDEPPAAASPVPLHDQQRRHRGHRLCLPGGRGGFHPAPSRTGDGRIAFLAAGMEDPGPMRLGRVREIGRPVRHAGQAVLLPERRLPLRGGVSADDLLACFVERMAGSGVR